jgi:DNA repair protein RecO (recombination protein O)
MKQTDKGIILNRISYGDSSFIVTVYTLEKGIQKFIFQGAKKKKVPIYPLLIAEITYYKRPDSELGKLTAVEAKNHLQELTFDPIKSVISFFIADVLLKCLKHEYEDSELYFFLESFIQAINDADDLSHFPIHFLTEFSKHLGICPNVLDENPRYFNLIDGELSNQKPIGDIYSTDEIATIIYDCIENQITAQKFSKLIRKDALEAMIRYYQMHIPQFGDLTTLAIIDDILYK